MQHAQFRSLTYALTLNSETSGSVRPTLRLDLHSRRNATASLLPDASQENTSSVSGLVIQTVLEVAAVVGNGALKSVQQGLRQAHSNL